MNKKQLVKCVRDGAMETMDLSDGERTTFIYGVGYTFLGGVSTACAAVVAPIGVGAVLAKAVLVGGVGMMVGSVGKAFIRGFREQWKIEMKHNNKK